MCSLGDYDIIRLVAPWITEGYSTGRVKKLKLNLLLFHLKRAGNKVVALPFSAIISPKLSTNF
jgi:hypothetical protein